MVAVMLELFFLPFMAVLAICEGKRRAAERARRLEEYRVSPESHLLHLSK